MIESFRDKKILITGGAGFIGSAVILFLIEETDHQVLNLDKLTYAGNLQSLSAVSSNPRYQFVQGDVCDHALVLKLFAAFKPDVHYVSARSRRQLSAPAIGL